VRVCDIVVKKFTFAMSSPDEFLSLTVDTTVFNSQQLFPSCLLIYTIYSLPVMLITFAMTVFSV